MGFEKSFAIAFCILIGLFALLLVVPTVFTGSGGNNRKQNSHDFGFGSESASAIVAVFCRRGAISKEIDKRTVLVLIPKADERTEFIIGKHLGAICCSGCLDCRYDGHLSNSRSVSQDQLPG